jgi:hypothetical protein
MGRTSLKDLASMEKERNALLEDVRKLEADIEELEKENEMS